MPRSSANTTHAIDVPLGSRSYQISIGPGLFDDLPKMLSPWIADRQIIVVSDSNVGPIYLSEVMERIGSVAASVHGHAVAAGEASKCVDVCQQLWRWMLGCGADRDSVVVALGGGVVGDLAGFVAATFGRGIGFIQLPTTLLAQVDSSVGGKVGINLPDAKNMVGAFWQPQTVVIDPLVLSTLDQRNFNAGMAEVIKYGLIMDADFFARLEQSVDSLRKRDPAMLSQVIADCCQCKSQVVQEDETERSGRRAILNYGHTYGHAIEAVFGYGEFLHGEAISIGMTCAAHLALVQGRVDESFVSRQTALFEQFDLPIECPTGRDDELLDAMKRDKKVAGGKLNLILPNQIGQVEVVPAPDDQAIRTSFYRRDLANDGPPSEST